VEVVAAAVVLAVDTVGLDVVVIVTGGLSPEVPRPSMKASKATLTSTSPEIIPINIFLFFEDIDFSFIEVCMAKGQNRILRILRNIALVVLAVIIVLTALGTWKWYGEKQRHEERQAAVSVFKKWDDHTVADERSWNEINMLTSEYSDLSTNLSGAFFNGNLSEMGRLAAESNANLDQQKKILEDIESQLQDGQLLIADMKTTVENLPDSKTTNKPRIHDHISKAEESTALMKEVISGYLKTLEYEYQITNLFTQRSQNQIDDGTLAIGLNKPRASSNELMGLVHEKFKRANDLGLQSTGAMLF